MVRKAKKKSGGAKRRPVKKKAKKKAKRKVKKAVGRKAKKKAVRRATKKRTTKKKAAKRKVKRKVAKKKIAGKKTSRNKTGKGTKNKKLSIKLDSKILYEWRKYCRDFGLNPSKRLELEIKNIMTNVPRGTLEKSLDNIVFKLEKPKKEEKKAGAKDKVSGTPSISQLAAKMREKKRKILKKS